MALERARFDADYDQHARDIAEANAEASDGEDDGEDAASDVHDDDSAPQNVCWRDRSRGHS